MQMFSEPICVAATGDRVGLVEEADIRQTLESLEQAANETHERIGCRAKESGDRKGMATTPTMFVAVWPTLYLLHVEEGVTSQVYGPLASTAEVEAGEQYLARIAESLRQSGVEVVTAVSHSINPRREIVRYAREVHPDLLVMGAHGHRRLKDLIFGTTIDPVRHELNIPILIVRK